MSTSIGTPRALKTWPLVTSPTGTEIGAPVSCTGAPRTRPSVGFSEMARTVLSPMWPATSRVRVRVSSPMVRSTCSALKISGISSGANSTSTTGPMTRATRPMPPSAVPARCGLVSAVTVIFSLLNRASALAPPTISLISWVISA